MQLVAKVARGAIGDHRSRLVFNRVGGLEAAELTPGFVELAAHRHNPRALAEMIFRLDRQFVVAAPRGRQIFQLLLGIQVEEPFLEEVSVARVGRRVEVNRGIRMGARHQLPQLTHMFSNRRNVASGNCVLVFHIHVLLLHPRHAEFAVAVVVVIDVEPESIHGILHADLLHLPQDMRVVTAARGGAHKLPGGMGLHVGGFRVQVVAAACGKRPIFLAHAPFRMSLRIVGRPANREVDRTENIDLVAGGDLSAQ